MLSNILSVIVISISGAMSPGPMTAVNITKSFENKYAGIQISLGHAIVEIPLMCLIYFGFGTFFQYTLTQIILSFAGGAMIIWMGYSMLKERNVDHSQGQDSKYNAFTAGMMMSLLNPYFIVWWATVGGLLVLDFMDNLSVAMLPVFYLSHWICDLIWMEALSILINKTQHFLGKKLQTIVFLISGLFLIGFGIYFWINGFKLIF